jgi:hypothetical protein
MGCCDTSARTDEKHARDPLCAPILVDCLVMEDAPNRLICMGQQLARLGSVTRFGTVDPAVVPA